MIAVDTAGPRTLMLTLLRDIICDGQKDIQHPGLALALLSSTGKASLNSATCHNLNTPGGDCA